MEGIKEKFPTYCEEGTEKNNRRGKKHKKAKKRLKRLKKERKNLRIKNKQLRTEKKAQRQINEERLLRVQAEMERNILHVLLKNISRSGNDIKLLPDWHVEAVDDER